VLERVRVFSLLSGLVIVAVAKDKSFQTLVGYVVARAGYVVNEL
jgi:hypothetical protein